MNNSRMSTPKFGFSILGLAALMFLTLLVMPASANASTTGSSTTSSNVFPGPTTGNGVKGAIAHTCTATVYNAAYPWSAKLQESYKYNGEWTSWPPVNLYNHFDTYAIPASTWSNLASAFSGCDTRVTYKDNEGTITVVAVDPWSGGNYFSCTTTGKYDCRESFNRGSRLTGDDLWVNYTVTRHR